MAYAPNIVGVPSRSNGVNVTIINSTVIDRGFETELLGVRCRTGLDQVITVINSSIFGRHWIPQPFTSIGIQNPEVWGDFNFGPGYVGHLYQEQWYLENLAHPIVFSLASGSLPPGLHLSTIGNQAEGQISGIPTAPGAYNFVLRATGPDVDSTRDFGISVTVIPSGGGGGDSQGTGYVGGN